MTQHSLELQYELENRVQARTGRRIRDLRIELQSDGIILRGHAATYYIKQLAQQSIRDVLPQVGLHNAIVVDQSQN